MSEARPPIDLPPTPKGIGQQMNSEVIPFRSTKINLKKSPLLYTVVAIGLLTLYMWGQMGQLDGPNQLKAMRDLVIGAVAALLVSMFAFIYLYSKSDKPLWAFLFPLLVVFSMFFTPAFQYLAYLFRTILPGHVAQLTPTSTVAETFIAHLFGAGLLEELIKATPALIGAALALNAAKWRPQGPSRLYDALTVKSPLDGLLFGVAAGAMFILIETGLEYSGGKIIQSKGDPGAIILGLLLVVPRTMGGVIGHMAYAGITGYFIGLAVMRPSMNRYKLILGGWLAASTIHAIWNTSTAGGTVLLLVSAVLAALLFVSCLLKARQLNITAGTSRDSYGSIVVDPRDAAMRARAAAAAPAAQFAGMPGAPAVPGVPARPAAQASAAGGYAQPAPVGAAPAAAAGIAPASAGATAAGFVLSLNGADFTLTRGAAVDFRAQLPALQGIGAEVTSHPNDPTMLGLRNLGATAWTVTMPNQSVQSVEGNRNVRLVGGMRIEFAPGVVGVVAVRP